MNWRRGALRMGALTAIIGASITAWHLGMEPLALMFASLGCADSVLSAFNGRKEAAK